MFPNAAEQPQQISEKQNGGRPDNDFLKNNG